MNIETIVSWIITFVSAIAAGVSVRDAKKSHNYVNNMKNLNDSYRLHDCLSFIDLALTCADDALEVINPIEAKIGGNYEEKVRHKIKNLNAAIIAVKGAIPSEYSENVEIQDSVHNTTLQQLDGILCGTIRSFKKRGAIVSQIKAPLLTSKNDVSEIISNLGSKISQK